MLNKEFKQLGLRVELENNGSSYRVNVGMIAKGKGGEWEDYG